MLINRSNYEVYFVDFLDGALGQSETAELHRFLKQNPDLAHELNSLQNIQLKPNHDHFAQKQDLKKSESLNGVTNYFDYLCISYLENNLTNQEKNDLDSMIVLNQSNNQTFNLYQKLKLKQNNSLIYKDKYSLKRINIFNLTYSNVRLVASIAAAVAVIFATSTLFVTPLMNNQLQVAEVASNEVNNPPSKTETKAIIEQYVETPQNKEVIVKPIVPTKVETVFTKAIEPLDIKQDTPNENLEYLSIISSIKLQTPNRGAEIAILSKPAFVSFSDSQLLADNESTDAPLQGRSREIGLFELAQLGIQRLSNITGGNISLDAEKDNDGRISKVNFETNLFAVSVPVKKK
jgi:hypothetical protein